MPTRDQTRRELRDVARLASVVGRDHPTAPPPPPPPRAAEVNGARATLRPVTASVPPPRPVNPSNAKLPLVRTPPKAGAHASLTPPATLRAGGRLPTWDTKGGRFVLVGATLAAAVIGGLVLGRVLTGKSGGGSHAAGRTLVVMPAETIAVGDTRSPPPETAPPAAGPTPTAISLDDPPVATVTPAVISITGSCPPTAAPRPARAPRAAAAAPRAGVAIGTGGTNGSGLVGTTPARSKAKRGRDSLDDLIRKAAAGGN